MTKEELSRYYYLQKEIKQIEDKIKEIDSTYMRASLINCEKFERTLSNPQEKRMILIEKYEKRLEEAKNSALVELIKIEDYIKKIENPEIRMIFRYRYIDFKEWDSIENLLHICKRQLYRIHNKQLKMSLNVT